MSIFTVSVLALLSVIADGIADTNYAKRKMTAAYLAQEGVEVMRNLRDTHIVYSPGGSAWSTFKNKINNPPAECDQANGCYFDTDTLDYGDQSEPISDLPFIACGSACPTLLFDSASGEYNYSSGDNSGFVRKIHSTVISPSEIKISATVSWTQGSGTYQLTLSENLFDWLE